jgi:2-keto-4-pentenoate hydratase
MDKLVFKSDLRTVIAEFREKCTEIGFLDLNLSIDLDDAYSVMSSAIQNSNQAVGAWKLGGTNQKTQNTFKVSEPYFGALFCDEVIFITEKKGSIPLLPSLKGEAEIALRISEFGAQKHNSGSDDASLIFDAWSVAIEFPYSVFSDIPDSGIEALVADRCAAGALVLGPVNVGLPPEEFSISIEIVGAAKSCGNQEDLLMSPVDAALDFRKRAFCGEFDLEAGQWVSTGGITACLRLNKYDTVKLEFCGETLYTLEI